MSGPATVTADFETRLQMPGTDSVIPVIVTLAYDRADPCAVTASFHVGTGKFVTWMFARELLRAGQRAHVGGGDVEIWPRPGGIVGVAISSPYGEAVFDFPARRVGDFIRGTYELVPREEEPGIVAAELDGLFGPGGALHAKERDA